jgi:hypothetical protein
MEGTGTGLWPYDETIVKTQHHTAADFLVARNI